jgi:hypothetical protein
LGEYRWTERSVRELTRIPDQRHAARVAAKAIADIEQTLKSATKNGGVLKAPSLTNTVRRFVDADLGIKRGPSKVVEPPQAGGRDLVDYLEDRIGAERSALAILRDIPADGWTVINEENPRTVKRLIGALSALVTFLEGVSQ